MVDIVEMPTEDVKSMGIANLNQFRNPILHTDYLLQWNLDKSKWNEPEKSSSSNIREFRWSAGRK